MVQDMVIENTVDGAAEFAFEGTAAKVWDALPLAPGASVVAIVQASGVSRPTATKALTAFAEAGRAVRTPGGRNEQGRQLPDTWARVAGATPDQPTEDQPSEDVQTSAAARPPVGLSIQDAMRVLEQEADRRAVAEAQLANAQAEEEARRQDVARALAKARMVEGTRCALTDLLDSVMHAYAALLSDDDGAFTTGLDAVYSRVADVRKAAKAAQPKTGGSWGSSRGDRSAPRPLRPEVLAHLAKFPDMAFTANEIAKVLDRSSGAVANALDTLAGNGEADLVSERPNRFRLATAQNA